MNDARDDQIESVEADIDAAADLDTTELGAAPATVITPGKNHARRWDKGLIIASFVIACGFALIVWGMSSAITGTDGIDRPDEIENVSPVENAVQVLQQDGIVVDLEFGFEAELIIDGIRLETTTIGEVNVSPGQQLELDLPPTAIFDPGNAIISFQPSDNAVITEFAQGRHEARVEFWPIEDPESRRSYNWSFTVV